MIDYSLYLITDSGLAGTTSILDIVYDAIQGGVTIVQYREKHASTKEMMIVAKSLRDITAKGKVPLIINDRIDIALAINADGVHIGQDDMPAAYARSLIGPKKILGVSVQTVQQAIQASSQGADYLGVADIFGTSSKPDAGKPIGLPTLQKIAENVTIPIVGVGGVNKSNAKSVIEYGADGIAVISAIVGKPNPEENARELFEIVKRKNT